MSENALDDGRLLDGRHHAQRRAAFGAGGEVELEDAFEPLGPAESVLASCGFRLFALLGRYIHDRNAVAMIGREQAVISDQMRSGPGDERRQARNEVDRFADDVSRAVAKWGLEFVDDLPLGVHRQTVLGDRRSGEITDEAFELVLLVRLSAYAGVQGEAGQWVAGAELGRGLAFVAPCRECLQGQHLAPAQWAHGDTIGDAVRHDGGEGLRIHALAQARWLLWLGFEPASARQRADDTAGETREQCTDVLAARWGGANESTAAGVDAVDAVEGEDVVVNVQIQRAAEALNEGDCTRMDCRIAALESSLPQQEARDEAMHHAEHALVQLRVIGEQESQRIGRAEDPLAIGSLG